MYRPHNDTCELLIKLPSVKGKTVLITGATDGIGLAYARILAWTGCNIVLIARSKEKAKRVVRELREINQSVHVDDVQCDLASAESLVSAIKMIGKIGVKYDLVFLNAGITSGNRLTTQQGFPEVFFVNHIAQQALIMGVQDSLARQSRIVIQSSVAHRLASCPSTYSNYMRASSRISSTIYADSKLANLYLAHAAGEQLSNQSTRTVTSYAVHPGFRVTNINRYMTEQPLRKKLDDLSRGHFTPFMLTLGSSLGLSQPSDEHAAHPALVASLQLKPGFFTGPSRYFGLLGCPAPATVSRDICEVRSRKLWQETANCINQLLCST